MRLALIIIILGLVSGCADGGGPPLAIADVEINRAAPGSRMSAGYLSISNNTSEDIEITSISSPQFAVVEMHETLVEDNVSRMRKLDSLVVAAGESVVFEPGGKHLMLMQPTGISREITLHVHAGDAVLLTITTNLAGN